MTWNTCDDSSDAVVLEIGPKVQRRRSSAVTTALPRHVVRWLPSKVAALTWYFILQLLWLITLQFLPRRRATNIARLPHIEGRSLKRIRLLAEGACAYVYEVLDIASNEHLAVKEVKCWNEEDSRLALDEAKLMVKLTALDTSSLDNETVNSGSDADLSVRGCAVDKGEHSQSELPFVTCYGYSEERATGTDRVSHVYTLMELCSESHLLDYLRRNGSMRDDEEVLKLLQHITRGLQLMHELVGVAHWDLKLENILRTKGGSWKICDFGSASNASVANPGTLQRNAFLQLEETIATRTTILYRPPEMVDLYRGHPIGPQADMWMLGCLLHAALLNRLPFKEASATAILSGKLDIPDSLCAEKPFFVSLIFWLLAPDPRNRPTANQLYCEVLSQCRRPAATLSDNSESTDSRSWQKYMHSVIEQVMPESAKNNRNVQISRNNSPSQLQKRLGPQ